MPLIVRGTKSANGTTNFGANTIAKSAEVNTDFVTIYALVNGNLDNDNLDLSSIGQTCGFTGTVTIATLIGVTGGFSSTLTTATLIVASTPSFTGLQSYTTNALAIAGGLTTGNLFNNNGTVSIVI